MITVINYNTHKSTSDAIGKKGGKVDTREDDIVYEIQIEQLPLHPQKI